MSILKEDLDKLYDQLQMLQNRVEKGFEERRLDMSYEKEKMRYEGGFNARNVILIFVLLIGVMSQVLFGLFIVKYFNFEASNIKQVIEVETFSDDESYSNSFVGNRGE